jgi:hypothetical protein
MQRPFPREVRQVLAELELISHGKTQSFNASGKSKGDSGRPFGDPYPEFIEFLKEFESCNGDWPHILERARARLNELKGTNRRVLKGETEQDRATRCVLEGKDWDVKVVANVLRMLPSQVRRYRAAAGMDVETGRSLDKTPSERAIVAQKLAAVGFSQQHIAEILETSQPTVCRLLRIRPKVA